MSTAVESSNCGPYEIVAQRNGSLQERANGTLELTAEDRYLVRLGEGADPTALRGALAVLQGGAEGVLQFGNYIGETVLGGRRLVVRSTRLTANGVQQMLDDVTQQLASLPFTASTPTAAPYARARTMAPDALYHAYAFLRDGMRGRGGHDVRAAMQRILARPHESLQFDDAKLVPLGHASQIDAATLASIHSEPELLSPLADGSPLTNHPLARRLEGRMPEFIRTRPRRHTTDTPENRFVVAALDTMSDIALQLERLERISARAASSANAREAMALALNIERSRRHPALASLDAAREIPVQSTVLRGRAGYRELLRFYTELLARTRLAEPHETRALLEVRDAAEIYEYWCYFRVVATVAQVTQAPTTVDRIAVTPFGARVPYGYRAMSGGTEVLYNVTYSRSGKSQGDKGRSSYSVRLRPDISVRAPNGRLHLFDAKLKVDFGAAVNADDNDEPGARPDTFKREDLYKMHAYRDAIGADSVWVLYPGSTANASEYQVPWAHSASSGQEGFQGVGAIALRPGVDHDGGLRHRIARMVGAQVGARGPREPDDKA